MTPVRLPARLVALAVGVALAASCDTRLPTQVQGGGVVDDVERPQIKFVLSSGAPTNLVEVGAPLSVSITASDNKGISKVVTTVRNSVSVTAADTVTLSPSATTTTRQLALTMGGAMRGDRLVIRTTVTDIALNTKVDSVVVTLSDSTPPSARIESSRAGRTLKGGDTVDVKVTAADSSGIFYAGYRLVRVAGTDTTVVRSDSAFVGTSAPVTVFTAPPFSFALPSSLNTGAYAIVGFAQDRSGVRARVGAITNTGAGFTVVDLQRPLASIQLPTSAGRVQIGDSIFVRVRVTDNVSLARVSLRAASIRGSAALGTADTVVRYPLITAPSATGSFAVGTRDTTITRFLKVAAPADTLLDSLVVFAVAVDASNNADTARVALSLVPGLSLTTNRPNAAVKTGETIIVRVVAGDTAAVLAAGFQVLRIAGADTTIVQTVIVPAPAGTTTFRPAPINYVVPDTLSGGTYAFAAVALTPRGTIVRQAPGFGFTVADAQKPTISLQSPLTGSTLRAGDSILVTAVIRDNTALQRVVFRGFTVRGRAVLGTADTVVRYTSITAPATGTFRPALRDTTITRYLKVVSPIDTSTADSLIVLAVVTDQVNLADTARAALRVNNTLRPSITLSTPTVGSTVNVGDSILVTARLRDDNGLALATFFATSTRGNAALGTANTVTRYAPVTTTFRSGLRDTTITRFIRAVTPLDTVTDSLTVTGVVVNSLGLVDTNRVRVRVVNGPAVIIVTPLAGDSANAGQNLRVRVTATHASGVVRLGFRINGDAINDSVVRVFNPGVNPAAVDTVVLVPATAAGGSALVITPFALSGDGQLTTAASRIVPVRTGSQAPAPLVRQTVSARSETSDSVTIRATGNGIAAIGYELRDVNNVLVKADTVSFAAPRFSAKDTTLALNLPVTRQGQRLSLTSFAIDQAGVAGYSVAASTTVPQTVKASAFVDFTLIVYGRTFPLPATRNGTIADVKIDSARGNIFLTNINFNLLEVFQASAGGNGTFAASGVPVGAQPWGMTLSRTNRDTLYVANSGGTNISRVFVGAPTAAGMREDLSRRILTRLSLLYRVTEARDQATGRIRIIVGAPLQFSDRPQYVEQSAGGRLYVTTRPTAAAPRGTARYLDPSAVAPDFRFILDFAAPSADPNAYAIANVDSIFVRQASAQSTANDTLYICDHNSGTLTPSACGASADGVGAALAQLRVLVPNTDVEARTQVDETTLGLTDTTFAAVSVDGSVVAFGEGNRAPFARAFLLNDANPAATRYSSASASINIADLVANASDRVFGLALDRTGTTLGVHGAETFFAEVNFPFTQRLQGKVSTFSSGAGIAFHPGANGRTSPQDQRLAFVSSANGTIEAVDIAFFFRRATLNTKTNLYGPLRASGRFPTDDPSVVLKLIGLSSNGLVVINLTAADIAAGPP